MLDVCFWVVVVGLLASINIRKVCTDVPASCLLQDIGFDGISPLIGTDDNVVNVYFDLYFPKAVSVANLVPNYAPRCTAILQVLKVHACRSLWTRS